MKIETNNTLRKSLTNIFKHFKSISEEMVVFFEEDKICLGTVDKAMVGMSRVEIKSDPLMDVGILDSQEFEEFEGKAVQIRADKVYSFLKTFEENLTIDIQEDQVELRNDNNFFKLPVLENGSDGYSDLVDEGINLQNENKVVLSRKKLSEVVKKTGLISKAFDIEGDGLNISFKAEDSKYRTKISFSDEDVQEMSISEFRSKFSIEYFKKMVFKGFSTFSLWMGSDRPVVLMADREGEVIQIKLKNVVAPRVEE